MSEIDAQSRESARQIAEGVSSRLTDPERARLMTMASRWAEANLDVCQEPLYALKTTGTLHYLFAGLERMTVAELAEVISDYSKGYGLTVGIIAGVIPPVADGGEVNSLDGETVITQLPPGQYI